MADAKTKVIASHRRRMKDQGFVRVEVRVHKEDAALLRRIAGALADPRQATEASPRFARPSVAIQA
jgi:hypothetical protein